MCKAPILLLLCIYYYYRPDSIGVVLFPTTSCHHWPWWVMTTCWLMFLVGDGIPTIYSQADTGCNLPTSWQAYWIIIDLTIVIMWKRHWLLMTTLLFYWRRLTNYCWTIVASWWPLFDLHLLYYQIHRLKTFIMFEDYYCVMTGDILLLS